MNIKTIKINLLKNNEFQTRISDIINDPETAELGQSILENGLLQPILIDENNTIIAGHRRVAASKSVGIEEIACIVTKIEKDENRLIFNVIENLHRKDLTAIETAMSFKQLKKKLKINNKKLSVIIKKSESVISKYLNLLTLHEKIQDDIIKNKRIVNRTILDKLAVMPSELKKVQLEIYNDFIANNLDTYAAKYLINKKINEYYKTDIHDLKPSVSFNKNSVQINNINIAKDKRKDLESKIIQLINSFIETE
ncbi:MAG: ParB/RepB/Spo0J family partition protein [Flavobacteriaceae bacterium]|nr:ParB/RepB/Spo0J family partition protein [Flavobacteriaceae bacterium]